MWGINPICSLDPGASGVVALEAHLPSSGNQAPTKEELGWIRQHAIPNEYGVTAPDIQISDLPPGNLGIDQVTVSLARS
jgi:hypothetical protein